MGVVGERSTAVLIKGLVKVYPGGVRGVDGLTLAVEDGEVYGLIGPNGSGKTTTLRILATVIKPTEGVAKVYGHDVVREALEVRRLVAYLPEEAGAYRDLTGMEHIRFVLGLRFRGRDLEDAVEEAVRLSGLGKALYRPIRTYSKGMRRILALATTLAQRPRLAILDEPTAGLDVEKSIEVRRAIASFNRFHGSTVLLSSHNMLEVENLCSRVGIIHRGRLVAEGHVGELKGRYGARNLEEVFLAAAGGVRG